MSSSKFSKPTYWVGLSMVTLPLVLMLAGLAACPGWQSVALLLLGLFAAALTVILFAKGHDLMMDASVFSVDD